MIPVNDLKRGFAAYQAEFEQKALDVLRSGWYVLGKEVTAFEEEFAAHTGAKYAIGVDNGLNAIMLGIRALDIGEGDEVIVAANTYIATVLGRFVEPCHAGLCGRNSECTIWIRQKSKPRSLRAPRPCW